MLASIYQDLNLQKQQCENINKLCVQNVIADTVNLFPVHIYKSFL